MKTQGFSCPNCKTWLIPHPPEEGDDIPIVGNVQLSCPICQRQATIVPTTGWRLLVGTSDIERVSAGVSAISTGLPLGVSVEWFWLILGAIGAWILWRKAARYV